MKNLVLLLVLFASACGASAPPRHEGPDVVTAEWTAGDDAPLSQ